MIYGLETQDNNKLYIRGTDEKAMGSYPLAVYLLLSWPFKPPLSRNYLFFMVARFGPQRLRYLPKVAYLVSSLSAEGWPLWGWNHHGGLST